VEANPHSSSRKKPQYRCSFCSKHEDDVRRLIAGPDSIYICDECVTICQEILAEDAKLTPKPENTAIYSVLPGRAYEGYLADSKRELSRLKGLLERLSDEEMGRQIGHGWTVGAALMHCAFWDRMVTLRREWWERGDPYYAPLERDALNNALLPQWLAIPPDEVRTQALEAAEAVHRNLTSFPGDQLLRYIASGRGMWMLFHTAFHRRLHLDEIERALAQNV
jgi:hypothetical protein